MGVIDLPRTPTSPQSKSPVRGAIRQVQASPQDASEVRLDSHAPTPVLQQPEFTLQQAPASPVSISPPRRGLKESQSAYISYAIESPDVPRNVRTPDSAEARDVVLPIRTQPSSGHVRIISDEVERTGSPQIRVTDGGVDGDSHPAEHPHIDEFGPELPPPSDHEHEHEHDDIPQSPGLRYSAFDDAPTKRIATRSSHIPSKSVGSASSSSDMRSSQLLQPHPTLQRPVSAYTLSPDMRGRALSPMSANDSDRGSGSPRLNARDLSSSRRSPSSGNNLNKRMSYIDLLNDIPYDRQIAPSPGLSNNSHLQNSIGTAASLLDPQKTLAAYRANIRKTTDAATQYEFAIFMIHIAQNTPSPDVDPVSLIIEARHILSRLSDRAYPFAQYYLGDGYSSGLFSPPPKNAPDHDKAFPLFVAASKHGHAEAGYRAALCYEFGWGTAKSYPKAVQFYRTAASKNHPGAATRLGMACLEGGMGLGHGKGKEGLKWLKRAQEGADSMYNTAPYSLGLLHLYGDTRNDVFKDESYAAQLLTQAAELGHVRANFMMGKAYEEGTMTCPRDAALSVHFYNAAATRGDAQAMMALCAWYMVGAEPVMEKDEGEAYAWAKMAAETGMAKAEYACGYFTEMGIGCRRDALGANAWYVSAAEKGEESAQKRLKLIHAAASGGGVEGVRRVVSPKHKRVISSGTEGGRRVVSGGTSRTNGTNGSASATASVPATASVGGSARDSLKVAEDPDSGFGDVRPMSRAEARTKELGGQGKKKFMGIF